MSMIRKLSRSRNAPRERGQALIEAALTLTAFVVILIGMIEVGEILFVHQSLVERTRSALRWAVVSPWDPATSPRQVTNLVLYGTISPPPGASSAFGLSASNVSVERPEPDYSAADRIVVTVQGYTLAFLSNAMVQAAQSNHHSTGAFTGLTIQEALPYELPDGSPN